MRYCLHIFIMIVCLTACESKVLNSPYSQTEDSASSILYSSFTLRPKHLDPARSYSNNEIIIIGQIYEPPFQYHYLKRPYTLIPLTAKALPKVRYFDSADTELTEEATNIAYSIYEVSIKPGIYFQPHPAFSKQNNSYEYHQLSQRALDDVDTLSDFEHHSTRELTAADYVYQIKRLAHPEVHSPILGLMTEYIEGLGDYAKQLQNIRSEGKNINLRKVDISGVTLIDRYTYQIKVIGKYPQLRYWLAMPFFAPMAWEADVFYAQKGLIEKNITLDWFPVGTGPYYLTENNPNLRMVLDKNPNFHEETYPKVGEKGDREQGLLKNKAHKLPFIDKIIFTLEKESISYWNKFLQGYYDVSGISSDSFEQAMQLSGSGDFTLSDEMSQKGIQLKTTVETSIFYIGFNMLDPVVGGNSIETKKLRQAISIAIDQEEYISIFANGRGIPAQGPIPPGIFGNISGKEGVNTYVYDWQNGRPVRKPISVAKSLLAEAGFPEGRSIKTGEPLVLYFDVTSSGPSSKARFDWMRKQFQKLGIQLVIRETDYNRFQDKMKTGQAQIFQWGWNADYPDPENFLFLLYGPNGKLVSGGENSNNYKNDEYDRLFERMRVMPNNIERAEIIKQMVDILRQDSPWVWGFHPKNFSLYHSWNSNVKPNLMANNTLKYRRVNAKKREMLQNQWNKPTLWPLGLIVCAIGLLLLPAWLLYQRKKRYRVSQ